MKAIIMSDSHGLYHQMEKVVSMYRTADLLIHTGDICGDEDYLRSIFDNRLYIVRGNNDYMSDLPDEEIIRFGNYKILATHGHTMNVYFSYDKILNRALKLGCDMAFFGHTHVPIIERIQGIWLVNSGSLAYPRGKNRTPSFATLEIDRENEVHFNIHYLKK